MAVSRTQAAVVRCQQQQQQLYRRVVAVVDIVKSVAHLSPRGGRRCRILLVVSLMLARRWWSLAPCARRTPVAPHESAHGDTLGLGFYVGSVTTTDELAAMSEDS